MLNMNETERRTGNAHPAVSDARLAAAAFWRDRLERTLSDDGVTHSFAYTWGDGAHVIEVFKSAAGGWGVRARAYKERLTAKRPPYLLRHYDTKGRAVRCWQAKLRKYRDKDFITVHGSATR